MINPILGVNVIVAVGSVGGMAGAAACIHHLEHAEESNVQHALSKKGNPTLKTLARIVHESIR